VQAELLTASLYEPWIHKTTMYAYTYRAVNSEGRTARRSVQRIRKEKEKEKEKKTRKNYAFQDVYYTNVERLSSTES
jgi:hypothetical protein